MPVKIYINGQLLEKEQAVVSVFDHGLLYGDGVFEGIRAYHGRVFMLREHLERLYNSARAILLEIPLSKKQMEDAVLQTLRANNLKDAYIRLVVTRGEGDLGLDPRKCSKPTLIIITDKITLYPAEFYENGLSVITSSVRRNIPEALNPTIKSLNYLNNILAKIEAVRQNVPEAIMLNREGLVAECTGDNIFVVKGNTLITPPTWTGALEGITRNVVMDLARSKLKLLVKEEVITPYHVYVGDEVFLTGTAAEVVPVREVDGRLIGEGKPGPATQKLMKEFKELTRVSGVPIDET
ncbi:MAG: branched-chain-amino-acid transaminase [Elusimicrobiota bacterium]